MKLQTLAKFLSDSSVDREEYVVSTIQSLTAELTKQAALILRNQSTFTTQNAKNWAVQWLNGDLKMNLALPIFLANPTIDSEVSSETVPPDGDVEYVVVAEVLPAIIPPEITQN